MCKTCTGGGCPHKAAKNIGLLALRIAIGIIFIYMGHNKLWGGHEGATAMFDHIGLVGGGSFWAYFVGTFELVGGLMVLFGAYVRLAALWLSLIMVVAMLTVSRGGPVAGYFLPLSVLGGTLALLGSGAGKYRVLKMQCCCKACKAMLANCGGCGGKCGGRCGEKEKMSGCCGGACGGNCGDKMAMEESCGCQNCCGGNCPCGAPNGQCACCRK